MDTKVRLYVDQPLGAGQAVAVGPEQATYLFAVMRLAVGAGVLLFNGRDGEWLARVVDAGKRRGALVCEAQTRALQLPPDLWLLFSPVRKERTNFIVEKAVELGVSRLMPVTTRFTQSERWRQDKQLAHAIEAAEQCGATSVPQVGDVQPLERALAGWPEGRVLIWADEALAGSGTGAAALTGVDAGTQGAILIGPEGGFSDDEKALLRGLPFVRPISLGPRILRAETAAVAALVLWQMAAGDWR
ncbi:16S rRNA (uracil(1498)-N(3))-methyltransferase [Pseudotabrizicola sediminis]|uniref:Ribosomal RNA small subunit methyltransferase E n=1 Tax=Pseudotabrizicola sediminis TaxID=2486418 RepID=A0ABY2KLW1_9RHOB|nr:16S rRNA (uracil(1498)-N(3))-methyltransferase [Pseudotabrizicola sediminis]TGD43530.1 16S rRNA (uracil(1498)-N(3))-methyltransferase [Pseudotabrizicola sediminis]